MCKKWQYLAQNDQKCRFWTKFGHFGPKILIFMGVSKSFGTNITGNHIHNLSALFFGQALDQMGQKCQYLAQNDQKCIFWTKFARFVAKNLDSYGGKQKFWYPHKGKSTSAFCLHCISVRHGTKWTKNANIWP